MDFFGENKPSEDFGRRSLRGGFISIAARLISAVVQIGSVVILARLLTPEDYGLVGMATAIIGIAPLLLDLGTRDAVIQQHKITSGEISALFWITTAIGCGLAIVVSASGPLIARFYGEPRLTAVAVISSLSLIGLALSYQHQALLRRAMQFRVLAIIDIAANVVSTVIAIIMAFKGFAYWSLAVRPVIGSAVQALGTWWMCRWVPGKPTFNAAVKEMIQFGLHWIGFSAADFVGKFADRIAIGYTRGATSLGFYQKSCLVYDNSLDLVTTPLHSVAATGLSKLRNNPEELWRSWAKGLSTLAFFAMPGFGLLSVLSQDIIVIILGEKWRPASILLSILAVR
ncbi:MAG: lipopolysaccharide biosynthesis protein, partial [Verrucomicrobia bacterium]|nr:lipopolysaccharide biosynthesis protein [Verrucomicrobiota bacterium]